jgi:predicted CoA-binding protein
MTLRAQIDVFLSRKRLAIVGVSRDPKDFTRALFREFLRRGYDAVPVNPNLPEVEGCPCFPRVQEIAPPVEEALLLTSPALTDQVVRDCAEAGIPSVWMHRGAGSGAVSRSAVEFCRSHGIDVIPGECPFMFLPDAGFPHGLHRFLRTLCRSVRGGLLRQSASG